MTDDEDSTESEDASALAEMLARMTTRPSPFYRSNRSRSSSSTTFDLVPYSPQILEQYQQQKKQKQEL